MTKREADPPASTKTVAPTDLAASASEWQCTKCSVDLEMGKVNISYLGSMFPVDLLRCPSCGQVLILEDLALGKMAEVEKLLEDK